MNKNIIDIIRARNIRGKSKKNIRSKGKGEKRRNQKLKVAVGLSGGVDSAVTAYLLKNKGYKVTGVYLKCWDKEGDGCTTEEGRVDAAKVSGKLKIPFKVLNFVKEYEQKVIDYFYNEYRAGRTPNPDILCNKEIKFGLFLDWAVKKGFDYVATGHYARIKKEGSKFYLMRGVDKSKDQSYFLYRLNQSQLKKSLFPLGGMKKDKVRGVARKVGLFNADKPDSMGICFIGNVDVKEFLKERVSVHKGDVLNVWGEKIGSHDGVEFYTVGQRKGFKVDKYHKDPFYVVSKDAKTNTLVAGSHKDCEKTNFKVGNLHWILEKPKGNFECEVRVRNLGELVSAKCSFNKDQPDILKVHLSKKIFSIPPGQSAVFYDGDVVVGGGIII